MDWAKYAGSWPMAEASRFVRNPPHEWHVQEAGEGPLLILLHGAGGATQSWRHLFPRLAKRFRVVAIDLPGQGFTRLGGQQRCGLDAMATDILALLKAEGLDQPAALVGHSAGAAIALRMAEQMTPAPPVISINGALAKFGGVAGLLFPIMAKALNVTPWVANFFVASNANPKAVDRLISGTGSDLSQSEQVFYRALVGEKSHVSATLAMMAQWSLDGLLDRLPRHPSRVLLIAADKDKAVSPKTADRAAAALPKARVVHLPDLGHLAHEEDADTVAREIEDFLREEGD